MPSVVGFPKTIGKGFAGKKGTGGGAVFSNVQIIGIPEAIRKLTGKAAYAKLQLGLLNRGAAEHMKNLAVEYCPYVTGNLKSGIKVEKNGSFDWTVSASSMEGTVGEKNWYEYAHFVENGTSKMAPRFFMQRAWVETRPLVDVELALLAKRIEA